MIAYREKGAPPGELNSDDSVLCAVCGIHYTYLSNKTCTKWFLGSTPHTGQHIHLLSTNNPPGTIPASPTPSYQIIPTQGNCKPGLGSFQRVIGVDGILPGMEVTVRVVHSPNRTFNHKILERLCAGTLWGTQKLAVPMTISSSSAKMI